MYVYARNAGVLDRRAELELVQAIFTELHSVEHQLKRVQVRLRALKGQHGCSLFAVSKRGQAIAIDQQGGTPAEAAMLAVRSLNRALMRPRSSVAPGAAPPPGSKRALAARRHGEAAVEPGSDDDAATMSAVGEGRVLLALHELEPSAPNVHWARMLAGGLELPMDACRVVAGVRPPASLPPGPQWLSATRRLLTETRSTRAWCRESLLDAELVEHLVPGEGGYVDEMALIAREQGSGWIVVPPDDIARGATVVELARRACRPVLVSRPPKTRCTLLVVTDGALDNYATLARAARLAHAFHAPVLAFHNVHASSTAPFVPVVDALARPWKQIQADAAGARPEYRLPELDVLLAYGRDPVDVVLQQARREDADMIIVGVRAESSNDKEASDALAAGVIDRAVRSVLVVPDAAAVSLGAESALRYEHASTMTSAGDRGRQQALVASSQLEAVESTRVAKA